MLPGQPNAYTDQHIAPVLKDVPAIHIALEDPKQPEFPDRTKEAAAAKAQAEEEARIAAEKAAEAARIAEAARLAKIAAQRAQVVYMASSAGNGYIQCAGYAKSRRPDIPNNWGNAYSWYSSAQSIGWPTGSAPRAGAIAWYRFGSHVAYVEAVNGDGTIYISEANYDGTMAIHYRTVPASDWLYIY